MSTGACTSAHRARTVSHGSGASHTLAPRVTRRARSSRKRRNAHRIAGSGGSSGGGASGCRIAGGVGRGGRLRRGGCILRLRRLRRLHHRGVKVGDDGLDGLLGGLRRLRRLVVYGGVRHVHLAVRSVVVHRCCRAQFHPHPANNHHIPQPPCSLSGHLSAQIPTAFLAPRLKFDGRNQSCGVSSHSPAEERYSASSTLPPFRRCRLCIDDSAEDTLNIRAVRCRPSY